MNERTCDWCGERFATRSSTAEVCSDSCRAARWKHRTGYGHRRERRRDVVGRRKSGPSGLQVSYRKAVDALAALHSGRGRDNPYDAAIEDAIDALGRALPDRQRARLEPRDG